MKVILCDNVPNLGDMGITVKVADGYARNFLIPRKLAVPVDTASARQIDHEMRIIKRREEKLRTKLTGEAKQLEAVTVEIKMRSGEEDKLYGSVTNMIIADKLAEMGLVVDRRNIQLAEPIKHLGVFSVPLKMGVGVVANLKIWVTAEQPEQTESANAAAAATAPEG